MIKVSEVYNDFNFRINKSEGGFISALDFNGISKNAELNFLDWLTGKVSTYNPPFAYSAQKVKDWVSQFITREKLQASSDGIIDRPNNYYSFENLYQLRGEINKDCEDDETIIVPDNPIELLDGSKFKTRAATYIEELQPSFEKPIAKMVGKTFEVLPKDIGSVALDYVRYPKFGVLVMKTDPEYNDQVPDELISTNYEWDDYALPFLLWFLVDEYSNHSRENALKQFNAASRPS